MEIRMMMRASASMILLAVLSGPVCAQPPSTSHDTANDTSSDKAPAFEAADVHVSPYRRTPFMYGNVLQGDRYMLHQATMVDLIATAYGVDASTVQGGPIWLERDRFDVIAKAPATTPPATVKLMLRSLLADRFKLVLHNGSQPLPAFVLTAGKGPPKLKPAEAAGDSDCKFQQPPQNPAPNTLPTIGFSCHHTTMEELARHLRIWAGNYLTDPVVDSTGLKGSWDFDIKWSPPILGNGGPSGISIFDAVDKQLGLKLERQTAPRPVLIVDSVNETPTPNAPGLDKILPPPATPQFDVAVITPSKPDARMRFRINGGQMDMVGVTLKFLIAFAWDFSPSNEEALAGAPKWLDADRFDILAKVVSEAPESTGTPPRFYVDDLRQMLKILLADRFKLQTHMEDRPGTAYTLIAVKPKLIKADPLSRTRCKEGPGPDGKDPRIATPVLNRLITCQNMSMAQIADAFETIAAGYIYSSVLDDTGIQGRWNFTLSFSSLGLTQNNAIGGPPPGASPTGGSTTSDPNGALSLFDAVSKELGLKLEKQTRPVPVLVIDHIEEKPTEN
jgi:uncharacterized protein (TIGR03435 family)